MTINARCCLSRNPKTSPRPAAPSNPATVATRTGSRRQPHHKPENRLQDLSAVQRINRQQVEYKQDDVQCCDCAWRTPPGQAEPPALRARTISAAKVTSGNNTTFTQRAGGDAPQHGPRSRIGRTLHVGDASQGPQQNPICLSSNRPAGQACMTKTRASAQSQTRSDIPRYAMRMPCSAGSPGLRRNPVRISYSAMMNQDQWRKTVIPPTLEEANPPADVSLLHSVPAIGSV